MRARGALLAVVAAAALAGCEGPSPTGGALARSIAEIRLLAGADRLVEGDSTRFQAIVLGTAGDTLDVEVRWTSLRPRVARVDRDGRVVALDEGETTIVAHAGGFEVGAELTVLQRVASIRILTRDPSVSVGYTVQLAADLRDADGAVAAGREPVWGTEEPSIASVSKTGAVRGQSPGATLVRAGLDGVADTVEVRVVAPEPAP